MSHFSRFLGWLLPYAEWEEPCGFQNTFFECPPDHMVRRRVYGWSQAHAFSRAKRARGWTP